MTDQQCKSGRAVEWCQWRRRAAPVPCSEGCPGWGIFNDGEIQRCDDCWSSLPYDDQPSDDDFEALPECREALKRGLAEELEACQCGVELLCGVAYVAQGVELDEPEECEDNACAGCEWCDAVAEGRRP